jgi:hypothetical protein
MYPIKARLERTKKLISSASNSTTHGTLKNIPRLGNGSSNEVRVATFDAAFSSAYGLENEFGRGDEIAVLRLALFNVAMALAHDLNV